MLRSHFYNLKNGSLIDTTPIPRSIYHEADCFAKCTLQAVNISHLLKRVIITSKHFWYKSRVQVNIPVIAPIKISMEQIVRLSPVWSHHRVMYYLNFVGVQLPQRPNFQHTVRPHHNLPEILVLLQPLEKYCGSCWCHHETVSKAEIAFFGYNWN